MDINPLGIYSPSKSQPQAVPQARANSGISTGRALRGGRATMDNPNDLFHSGLSFLAPFSADQYWRDYKLDVKTLDRVSMPKLMELLADGSPEVSRALWDCILMCAPGWECKAYRPGSKDEDATAKQALDDFFKNLHGPYSVSSVIPAKVVIGSLFMQPFMRGAFAAELVLDSTGRIPLEIATPDPAYIRFKKINDVERGGVWQMYQWQQGQEVILDRPTICYVPLHPFPGQPYGRSIASSALFTCVFLLGILHDIKRVVQQQGWPRMDIEGKWEVIAEMMPTEDKNDSDKATAWVNAAINEVSNFYGSLEPDDAYVHLDAWKVNQPVGTMNASSLGAVDGIIRGLERMATRGLKTMPLLMATTDGVSEANANRQWEIHAAGIKSLQQLCEPLLERLLTLALQVQGIAATVEFRFAELRAAELLRDEQTRTLQVANEARIRDEGWQTNNEASNKISGHDAVANPTATSASTGGLVSTNPDPGSNRSFDRYLEIANQRSIPAGGSRTEQQAELLWRTYKIETQGSDVTFPQWWQERLGNPFSYDEAWERLKRSLVEGPTWVAGQTHAKKPNGDSEVIA